MSFWSRKRNSDQAVTAGDTGKVQKAKKGVKRSSPVAMEVKDLALEALDPGLMNIKGELRKLGVELPKEVFLALDKIVVAADHFKHRGAVAIWERDGKLRRWDPLTNNEPEAALATVHVKYKLDWEDVGSSFPQAEEQLSCLRDAMLQSGLRRRNL
jgi:hypothetical protein